MPAIVPHTSGEWFGPTDGAVSTDHELCSRGGFRFRRACHTGQVVKRHLLGGDPNRSGTMEPGTGHQAPPVSTLPAGK